MAESAHAHTGPSDDSPCYNCGAKGHWVVACPEPTRKTPAGLANAWRNAPNAPNAGHGNHRQHHGGNPKRMNKGPIITKYAPPPPPPPPPPHPSSLSHGTAPYPPLPPGPPYPQQNPQFQSPYAHYQPAAHYSAGYGQTYPSQQYHQPPYGAAPAAPAGYAAHPPGPPAPQPPAPYPAGYASYPPAGPSSAPGYPPQTTYPQSYPQPPYGLPQVPYPAQSGPAHFPPPPKPPHVSRSHSGLNQPVPVHHSLPPKPPRSVHTQQEPHRDHRNRRKHDRQNKNRDNRRRDQGSRHRSSQQKMQNKANRSNRGNRSNRSSSAIRSSHKASASATAELVKTGPLSSIEDLEKNSKFGSEASKEDFPEESAAAEIPVSDNAQSHQHEDDMLPQLASGELDEDSETADSESGESTDNNETEPPRTVLSNDEVESARDDERRLSLNTHHHGRDEASTPSSMALDTPHLNGKHKRRDDESEDERQPKKSKAAESLAHDLNDAEEDNQAQTQYDTGSAVQGNDAPIVEEEDEPVLPPLEPESRSRSKERHQGPKSRNSSVSSRSSDLNSLEAELLGRPAKQRSPDDIGVHQRQDRVTLPTMQRRRQRNADSAYSRRW
ncbi:hypothetical protein J3E69DRAFT_171853 [Trichoderma sp. SZMC 28015]